MTLQHHIRSKYEDQLWRQRVYLCERFLSDIIDKWCLSDDAFPTPLVVAGALYLFAPRCEPFNLSPYRLRERLTELVVDPEEEYRAAWPRRDAAQGHALIASLSSIVDRSVASWIDAGRESSGVVLAELMVGEVVAQQYVIFHHFETTRRDINRWGI